MCKWGCVRLGRDVIDDSGKTDKQLLRMLGLWVKKEGWVPSKPRCLTLECKRYRRSEVPTCHARFASMIRFLRAFGCRVSELVVLLSPEDSILVLMEENERTPEDHYYRESLLPGTVDLVAEIAQTLATNAVQSVALRGVPLFALASAAPSAATRTVSWALPPCFPAGAARALHTALEIFPAVQTLALCRTMLPGRTDLRMSPSTAEDLCAVYEQLKHSPLAVLATSGNDACELVPALTAAPALSTIQFTWDGDTRADVLAAAADTPGAFPALTRAGSRGLGGAHAPFPVDAVRPLIPADADGACADWLACPVPCTAWTIIRFARIIAEKDVGAAHALLRGLVSHVPAEMLSEYTACLHATAAGDDVAMAVAENIVDTLRGGGEIADTGREVALRAADGSACTVPASMGRTLQLLADSDDGGDAPCPLAPTAAHLRAVAVLWRVSRDPEFAAELVRLADYLGVDAYALDAVVRAGSGKRRAVAAAAE